jgi:hypothetical protein
MNAPNASGWRPAMGEAGDGELSLTTAGGDKGLALEEKLIFELGRPGTCGVDMDEPQGDVLPGLARHLRKAAPALPGLSEPETVRHYTRLSRQNYAIDLGPFPLGSCTMKHNPRLNEKVARLPGFADVHPLQPQRTVRGAYEAINELAHWLMAALMHSRPPSRRAARIAGSSSSPKAPTAPIPPLPPSPVSPWRTSRRPRTAGSTWRRSPRGWGLILPG